MASLTTTRNAVAVTFATNGVLFATLVSRLPDVRRELGLGNSGLGFLLLAGSAASLLALRASGWLIQRTSAAAVVRGASPFVTAMTVGRLLGGTLLDRFGRAPVLWASSGAIAAGVLLVVLGGHWLPVSVGSVVWGLGASLGFPVGMSAAADDPVGAPARVSVVSTIGYGAFLAGPPLLGMLGDRVGTLEALLVIAVLMVPAGVSVSATRQAAGVRREGVSR